MPTLRNNDGQEYDVSDVDAVEMSKADPSLQIVGDVRSAPGETGQAPVSISSHAMVDQVGHSAATEADQQAYSHREYLKDKTSTLGAAARGAISMATFGLSDYIADPDVAEADQAHHQIASLAGQALGLVAPGMILGKVGGLVRGAELARDPVAAEHAAEALSSTALYGGKAVKGASGLESELVGAKKALGEATDFSDLAGLDAKGLRAAEKDEIAAIKAGRGPQGKAFVDDLGSFRRSLKEDDKIFLATKGIKETELPAGAEGSLKIQEIGKTSLDADRQIDRLLRNPKALAERPQRALDALQQQETALEHLQARESTLRPMFAADTSGERAAALDAVPGALERNRALQSKVRDLVAAPSSARLDAITAARDALSAPTPPKSLAEQMLGGAVFSTVSTAAHALPGGSIVSHLLGAKASQFATDAVFGRLAGAAEKGKALASKAVDTVLGVAKASPAAPILASRVLADASYAAPQRGTKRTADLPSNFHRVSAEIRAQTAYNAMGVPEMRPEARATMAELFKPIALHNPLLADQLETLGARRIEFLASKLPRMPDVFGIPVGPSTWHPSDLEMRQFASYVWATENPSGVEKLLAQGSVSPEHVEAYKAIYPQRYQQLQQQILGTLPTLRQTLPYQKKLALSIFTGVAVDPALDPRILRVLQAQFAGEDGSAGGTQAPKPQPQFGSVRADIGTKAQQREAGMQ